MQYIPAYTVLTFLILFFISTFLYPGGSQADTNSVGFSWMHNYWCDLIWPTNHREEPNPAAWAAVPAMIILCIGLVILFYQFPNYYPTDPRTAMLIRIFGAASMVCASLLFTPLHDIMIPLASLCGLIALVAIFYVLFGQTDLKLFYFGIVCMVLMGLNNAVYYSNSESLLYYLPLLQKISFLVVLTWIVSLNLSFNTTI